MFCIKMNLRVFSRLITKNSLFTNYLPGIYVKCTSFDEGMSGSKGLLFTYSTQTMGRRNDATKTLPAPLTIFNTANP